MNEISYINSIKIIIIDSLELNLNHFYYLMKIINCSITAEIYRKNPARFRSEYCFHVPLIFESFMPEPSRTLLRGFIDIIIRSKMTSATRYYDRAYRIMVGLAFCFVKIIIEENFHFKFRKSN